LKVGVVNIQYAANSQYNMGGTRRGVELREREREKEREKERVKEYRHIGGIFTGCTRHDL